MEPQCVHFSLEHHAVQEARNQLSLWNPRQTVRQADNAGQHKGRDARGEPGRGGKVVQELQKGLKEEDAKELCQQMKEAKAAMIKSDQLQLSQGGSAPLAGSLRAGGGVGRLRATAATAAATWEEAASH